MSPLNQRSRNYQLLKINKSKIDLGDIIREEVYKVINAQKNNKASGIDHTPAEFLKMEVIQK